MFRTLRRRGVIAAAATTAALGLVLASAAPAFAAGRTIAAGDSLFAIDCDLELSIEPVLFSVDTPTGALTEVGSTYPTTNDGCAYQAAHDVTTGKSYFVESRNIDGPLYELFTIDHTTGASAVVSQFFVVGDPNTFPHIVSMAIGKDGAAYAIDLEGTLYDLNLTTGEVDPIGPVDALPAFFAFASDPTSGLFYILARGNSTLYQLDVTDGSTTEVFPIVAQGASNVQSMQIDREGMVWFQNWPEEPELWSVPLAGNGGGEAEVFSGVFMDGETVVGTESLLLIPGKALPATGGEAGPLLLAGLGVLVLGGALLLVRRRTA